MARKPRYKLPSQETVAAWLRQAPPSQPWWLEGPVRHWLRAQACLQGCRWARADELARRLVARARSITNGVGAPRGWDVNTWPGVWPECWICGKPFSPQKPFGAYCSPRCHWRAAYIRETPTRLKHCARCNDLFEASYKSAAHQEYCSRSCQRAVEMDRDRESGAKAERQARHRKSDKGRASQERRNAARREQRRLAKLNGHAKPNGHADAPNGPAADDRPGAAGDAPGVVPDSLRVGAGAERAPRLDAVRTAT